MDASAKRAARARSRNTIRLVLLFRSLLERASRREISNPCRRRGAVRSRVRGKTDFPREHYHFSWRGLRRCGDYRFEPPPRQVIKSRDPAALLLILDCLRLVPSLSFRTGLPVRKRH